MILERNVFALSGQSGLALGPGVDPTGVVFVGSNRNTFVGSDAARSVLIDAVSVLAGKSWALSSEGGAVFRSMCVLASSCYYDGAGVELAGSVTVASGTVFKADSGGMSPFRVVDGA